MTVVHAGQTIDPPCASHSSEASDRAQDTVLPSFVNDWISRGALQGAALEAAVPPAPPKVTKVIVGGGDYAIVDVAVNGLPTLQVSM